MKEVKIIHTTASELTSIISDSVKKELDKFKKELNNSPPNDQLLTREETRDLLKVNYSTLYLWDKSGKLVSKKIGNRVYYLKTEVLAALNSSKLK